MEPVNFSEHPERQQLESIFPFLDESAAGELSSSIEVYNIDKNSCLFEAGDPCDAMYILIKGEMAVQKATGFGRNIQTIALLQPHAPVGESAITGSTARKSTVQAVKKAVLLKIDKQAYKNFAQKYPRAAIDLLHHLLAIVGLRLEKCSHRLAHIL